MSDTLVRRMAEKVGSQQPEIQKNQAVSVVVPFAAAKPFLEGYPAPKRPNRNRPIIDLALRDELDAWELASDEACEMADSDSPEL